MKNNSNDNLIRVGICKHTGRKVLQLKDSVENDALDENGWLCLHDDTIEEEISNILKYKFNIPFNISIN